MGYEEVNWQAEGCVEPGTGGISLFFLFSFSFLKFHGAGHRVAQEQAWVY
jgi:hypothetical protein